MAIHGLTMLNTISTPPSRGLRLPSLEPYQPKSGATGVPDASVARFPRGPPRRCPSPLPESSSEKECEGKLNELIGSMEDVLRGYAGYPAGSPTYLATLHDFYHRAMDLKAHHVDDERPPDESACGDGPNDQHLVQRISTFNPGDISPTHPNQPRRFPRQLGHTTSPTLFPASFTASEAPKPLQLHSSTPPLDKVQQLAKEWWNSEVAAAWYGPRPMARPSRSPTNPKRKLSAEEEHERLRVSLEELDLRSTGRSERIPAFTGRREAKMERERQRSVKRESSFVGLNDE